MYNHHLDTFLKAADSGSFLKAAEQMYISANAVTKQVNLLERELGVTLFLRSHQGLKLTEAGELIYVEAKKLIQHSNTVLRKARGLEQPKETVIRVGVSLMNPANLLLEQWGRAAEVLDHLGERIDVISCPYDTNFWGDRYQSFHLNDLPLCVACAKNHPLAVKDRLTLPDLYGETLWIAARGMDNYMDRVRDDLENHPQIHLKDSSYLNLGGFNQLVASRDLAISAPCWSSVHPLLATIPVEWEHTLPYGLIYAKDPSKEVMQFVVAVGQFNAKP